MVKSLNDRITRPHIYQQALDDFGITELLSHLSNYSDTDFNAQLMNLEKQELESLAAILIQRLTENLTGKQIASYLNAIRHGDSYVLCDPTNLEIPLASPDIPVNFPNGATPQYKEGDRVRWRPLTNYTDWGIVIGRYYNYSRHRCVWAVCYLIRLDEDSPSAAWTATDTAWEEDLEAFTDNSWEKSAVEEIENRENGESALPSFGTNQQTLHPIPQLHPAEPNSFASFLPSLPYPFLSKSLHTPPGTYNPGERNRTHPRPLTRRELNLIQLYSYCQLGMTPMRFYSKWEVTYEQIALICDRSTSTVRRWFLRSSNYQPPHSSDLRHLALMDFLLEYFEKIPSELRNLLCSTNPGH